MNTIKKLSALILLIILSGIQGFTQTTIPNAGFETWVNGEPQYWDTSNKNILGTLFEGVIEDTLTPQNGNSAVMMKTTLKVVGIIPVTLPGIITLGEIIIDYVNQTGTIAGGIPFTGRPDEFRGYYKASPASGDSCFIGIGISKWNGNQRDTIAEGYFFESSKVQNWTEFIIPLDYNTIDNPDSMNIIIGSSDITNMMAVPGSTLWVDNLSLVYGGVSVTDLALNKNFAVYPDDSRQNIIIAINFDETQKTKISMFTIDGKQVYEAVKSIRQSEETINISSLPPGIYIINIRTNKGNTYSQKISLN